MCVCCNQEDILRARDKNIFVLCRNKHMILVAQEYLHVTQEYIPVSQEFVISVFSKELSKKKHVDAYGPVIR